MNHTLSQLVLEYVKQVVEEKSIYSPTVLEVDDGSDNYPKIMIKELSNVQNVRDGQGFISFSNVQVEIILQAKDKEESKTSIIQELSDLCDEVCNQILGLKRVSYKPENNTETGILQLTLVYQAILNDLRNVYY